MEVENTSAVQIIDIEDDNDDIAVICETLNTSKGKGIKIGEKYSSKRDVEVEIISSFCSKPSSSGTKKVFIDLSKEYSDDEIRFLGCQFSSSRPKKSRRRLDSKCIVIDDDDNDIFTCDICVDEKSTSNMFKIIGCTHSYCKECMAKYVASKLQENVSTISCPVPGCNGLLEPYYCCSILPKEVFDRWGDALCEKLILGSERFYCPFKDCSALLIDECSGGNFVITQTECPECKRLFCAKCKVAWHLGILCEEFQKSNKDEKKEEEIQLMKLAKRRKWRRCPNCKIYVARNKGCNHMHCRCGCHFCYKCGAAYPECHCYRNGQQRNAPQTRSTLDILIGQQGNTQQSRSALDILIGQQGNTPQTRSPFDILIGQQGNTQQSRSALDILIGQQGNAQQSRSALDILIGQQGNAPQTRSPLDILIGQQGNAQQSRSALDILIGQQGNAPQTRSPLDILIGQQENAQQTRSTLNTLIEQQGNAQQTRSALDIPIGQQGNAQLLMEGNALWDFFGF